ncbi:hypothetical protein DQ238_00175 [Geodermatophilus sp. TF02-6]|uniref:hypothetical protein n=1 Tax=Geodermatophilus sp. TF02-6 TaxID=2250575 RepID=UPI000DEBB0FE|nr:hypothetical protein [Geodermatophilus sp. TF02-6]RBY83554.1 hypothetical protein DQ238_00175 [Geodermatophilus sp. TF02-6]
MIGQVVGAPLTAEEEAGPASIGIVRGMWRNSPVENAHTGSELNRISDGEIFAANVALTRLSLERYRPTGGTDWQALFDAVTDPDRVRAGNRTTGDLVDELYEEWYEHAARATDGLWSAEERYGARQAHLMLVLGGVGEQWRGAPWWPDCVAEFAREHPSQFTVEELRLLVEAPDALGPETLERAVDAGIGFTRGFDVWRSRRG